MEQIKQGLQTYKTALVPPYGKKDFLPITLTVVSLVALGMTLTVLREQTTYQSRAQIAQNIAEPENGTLAGNVIVVNDANASGGKYIKFNRAPSDPYANLTDRKSTRLNSSH